MFRFPSDDPEQSRRFYDDGSYQQGFTTDLPDTAELKRMTACNFRGTPKDYSDYITLLGTLGLEPGDSLFDFGSSWGYGAYQLTAHGFRVTGHEISGARRTYAEEHLGINFFGDFNALEPGHPLFESFDCFFSAHVLEHVPRPRDLFEVLNRLLRPGGIFVSFTPNGCEAHRRRNRHWNKLWGEVHPNFIDDRFLRRGFADWPSLLAATPYDWNAIERPVSGETIVGPLGGHELMFVAVKGARRAAGAGWK
jgi:SAM-dependent methyltransferase